MGEEKRKREERTVSEADKALKSPRLEGQAVARKSQEILGLRAVQVVPASPSDSSRSDSDGNSAPCHHQCLDSESVDIAVFAIKDSKELPTCHYPGCGITWKGASESKEGMMKCMECHYISCAGWPVDRGNPQRHALWHFANFPNHYVAQWYDAPSLGYCFECKRFMRLTDEEDQSSDDEGSEVNRKVNDDQEMVASKTTDLQGMVAGKTTDQRKMVASSSKVDWAMVASNSKVDLAMVASNAMDQWGMLARDDASRYATGDGYVIRGMPNRGNTCYMNASLQCLLALGKLRTTILSPDARLGYIGLKLKQLFVETSSASNARHTPDPKKIQADMQSLYPGQFKDWVMEDSHEFLKFLHDALDNEVVERNESHLKQKKERVSEADKALKSLRLERQVVGGKSLESLGLRDVQVAPASPSDSSGSDSDSNSAPCHHHCLDSESVDIAIFAIKDSEELPTCHYPGCGITWKGAGENKEGMMKCMEFHYISCAGWPVDRGNPQRHALWHFANFPMHYVAQWYDEPSLGYCFECKRFMRLTDDEDQSSDDEGSEVNRKVNDDREMVASKTTDRQGMVASKTTDQPKMVASESKDQQGMVVSSSKTDWAMVASNSKVDLAMVASNAMDQWGMLARDDASRCATGDGYVIRGMPNHGNTCFMNASLQCLLALGKLWTTILSPDARLGYIGLELKQLFVETSSASNARHTPEDAQEATEEITAGASCDENDLTSYSTTDDKAESHEDAQEAAPSCLPSGNSKGCQLFAKTLSGTTLSLQIELNKTSEDLACLIQQKTKFTHTEQYLEYQGCMLKPNSSLKDQGIGKDSTIMIRSRILGGRVILTQIPLAEILRLRAIPGHADPEPEFSDPGLKILRGVVRSATQTLNSGKGWTGPLRLEDFSVENGKVHINRPATEDVTDVLIRSNLNELATSIEHHFVHNNKRPAYLENLIERLRNATVVWDEAVGRYTLCGTYTWVLLSHFAGLSAMCRANVLYQLKIYYDSLEPWQKVRFRSALHRCRLNGYWLYEVAFDGVVSLTYIKGTYWWDAFSAFLLSRNYCTHLYANSLFEGVRVYDCNPGLEILLFLCLGHFLADVIPELMTEGFDLSELLVSCCHIED